MAIICASTQLFLPLFSLGYPETATILVSHTLPSPRALVALLARGVGEINGLTSEQKLPVPGAGAQIEARLILQWIFESSSYAFSRPLSPLKRSSQIWRVVWLEKAWREEVLRDAIIFELISLSRLAVYIFLDVDLVNELLRTYLQEIGELTTEDIKRAFQIVRVVGKSEMLASPISVEVFDKFNVVGSKGQINTYCPLDWLERVPDQGLIEDVLVSLRFLSSQVEEPTDLPEYRREKKPFVLPLLQKRTIQRGRIVEYFEPVELYVEVKEGYTLVDLPDGGKAVLPKEFLGVK